MPLLHRSGGSKDNSGWSCAIRHNGGKTARKRAKLSGLSVLL